MKSDQVCQGIVPEFTKEEFLDSKLNSILSGLKFWDLRSIQRVIEVAISDFEVGSLDWRVSRFFLVICSVHFDVNRREVYSPMMVTGSGSRTIIPGDVLATQWDEINKVIGSIECSLLRAFVADMMWECSRKRWELPALASQAFCEVIESYLEGGRSGEYGSADLMFSSVVDFMERTFQILNGSGKKNDSPGYVRSAWERLWRESLKRERAIAFVRLSDIGLNNGLIDYFDVAKSAENLAGCNSKSNAMAEKKVWELAAYCYEKLKDSGSRLRCQLQIVAQTLRMRDSMQQAMAKASWTRDAIQELRQIGGQKEKIRVLWNELLEYQDEALDDYGSFSIPLNLSSQIEITEKAFSGKSLSEMLRCFSILARPIDVEELKKSALDNARSSPLMALIGMTRIDREGRVVSSFSGSSLENEPNEEWFKNQYVQYLDLYFQQVVGGYICPAINIICNQELVYEKYFYAIVERSPFVPVGFRECYAKGFWMMFQGDFISAAYLLVPMLENSIRYVLSIRGQDSSKMLPDSTQEDRSLSGLLESMRVELEEIFGVSAVNELDLLFNFKGGPALRHQVAHGKLTSGDCFHHSVIYGCWLIYRLACLPLFEGWDDDVRPVLDMLR